MSRVYAVWLTPASVHNKAPLPEYWEGRAAHVIDALTMARAAMGNTSVTRFWRCRVEVLRE